MFVNMPNLSIIIPIYNSSEYLNSCINSVLHQTFTDYELILIDDGSSDDSADICRNFARYVNKIIFVHQENQGVSCARNKGIELAQGKWITFIDSDDWIESDYLENLVNAIPSEYCEIISSGLVKHFSDKSCQISRLAHTDILDFSLEENYLRFSTQELITSPVSKLYLTSFIRDNHLKFNASLSYGEDRDFNARCLTYATKGLSISYTGYHYRHVPSSLSHMKHNLVYENDIKYWQNLKSNFDLRNMHSLQTRTYLANRLFNFVNDYITMICKEPINFNNKIKFIQQALSISDSHSYMLKNASLITSGNPIIRWQIIHKFVLSTAILTLLSCK